VSDDLRTISGTLRADEAVSLVDPLALLPDAPDDRTTFRTWPGRPERGQVVWEPAGEGAWRFTTTLPRRYGSLGVLPRRGLWANGGWYPQPLVDGAVSVADWSVSVALPDGVVGVVGDVAGEGTLRWEGRGERAALAGLLRGRVTTLEVPRGDGGEGATITLLEDGPRRQDRNEQLVALLDESWTLDGPAAVTAVESRQLRRLVRAAPGTLFLSDRAFRMTGRLGSYHRAAVARGLLQAALPVEDPWGRAIAADAMARAWREAAEARDAEDLLRFGAWIPEIDSLLYDGSVPFVGELFFETFPADPLADDLLEMFDPRTLGQVVSVKLDDRYGAGSALALAEALTAGASLEAAAEGLGFALDPWRAPYPEQDYTLAVSDAAVTVTREAPADAPAEPVVLEVDGERLAWLAGPGSDTETWTLDSAPEQVRLDPDKHLAQTDYVSERWPARWTSVFTFFPYNINLSDQTFSAAAGATIRKQYDTHNLLNVSAFTDPVNLAGATLTWRYAVGRLLDRRSRPHRLYLSATPALLNPNYRPTSDGRYALGAGVAWRYDDRVDYHFPLEGKGFYAGAGAGFVPGGDQRWASLSGAAEGVWSPHPRHSFAGEARAGLAAGEVEHRLLGLGGASNLRSVQVGEAVGDWRAVGKGEYRVAVIRNASVPMWLLWGSELQLTVGAEVGVMGDARLEGGGRVEVARAAGWTAGISGIGDLLGARPTMLGVTAAGLLYADPVALEADFPVQIYLRWFQAF